ncbi:hypothetical protein HDU85_005859 [Gaertneriomyces sp. JEL0708]|nr:hypothetical protein HDU85_005859 [Gaertneriomyces sp. JEL0708]
MTGQSATFTTLPNLIALVLLSFLQVLLFANKPKKQLVAPNTSSKTMPAAKTSVTTTLPATGTTLTAAQLSFDVGGLLNEVFSLYTAPNGATQKQVFAKNYSEDAIFEDPLIKTSTARDREAQFASLPAIFSKIEIMREGNTRQLKIRTLSSAELQLNGLPPSASSIVVIEVPNTQTYHLPLTNILSYIPMAPKKVPLDTVTKLFVNRETGKIVKHQDVWTKTGENLPGLLPLVGGASAWAYGLVKPLIGKGSSLGLRGAERVGLIA